MKKFVLVYLFLLCFAGLWAQESESEAALRSERAAFEAWSVFQTPNPTVPKAPEKGAVKAIPETPDETAIAAATTEEDIPEDELPELDIEVLLRGWITKKAREYMGVPYKYAGAGPDGFDCSGFVYFVYREAAGMDVSRSTAGIWNSGKKIPLAETRPGDVLLFTTVRPGPSHTGIVLENGPNGVIFIHAASQGAATGIIISNMNERYYKTRFLGARTYF
jgi:hypothetical protein